MELIKSIQVNHHKTVILVSHDMNDVARYAEEIIVMRQGKVIEQCSPKSLFRQHEKLKDWHIALPDVVQLQYDFEDKYQTMFNDIALNEDEFVTLYQEKNMKNKLIIGRYLPNNSVIHRLDPRAKLIFVFVFIIFIFLLILLLHSLG